MNKKHLKHFFMGGYFGYILGKRSNGDFSNIE